MSSQPRQRLALLPETFAICKLSSRAVLAGWEPQGSFVSIAYTSDELSLICATSFLPDGVTGDSGWRCFKVEGPFDLMSLGIMASVVTPLAAAPMSVFAVATHDTDYVLVHQNELERAIQILTAAGHTLLP